MKVLFSLLYRWENQRLWFNLFKRLAFEKVKSGHRYWLLSGRKSIWAQRVCLQFLFLTMTKGTINNYILWFKSKYRTTPSVKGCVCLMFSSVMFVVFNWTQNNVEVSWRHPFQQIPCTDGKIYCFGWSVWYPFQMSFRIFHLLCLIF